MISNKKSSIILLLKVLEEYTDEDHYLTQSQIVDKIYQLYGIELERKSIGSSLQILEELDYDIARGNKGGFALLSRTFDNTEVSYLIDAIFSSKSLSGKLAKKLSASVSSCLSKYQRKDYSCIHKTNEINRTSNNQVFLNIQIINDAIKQGKRVGFQYLSYDKNGKEVIRKNGYQYIVSPYYLINNFGRYYLLCNYREKYRPLQIFRIDYMVNLEIKNDWDIKNIKDLEGLSKDFSITKYMNEHIYIMDGDTIDATVELDNENIVSCVKDWFGDLAKIYSKEDKIFADITCNENALYYWVMQYSDCVKVISPNLFKERIKNNLKEIIKRYED